jgi:hypothetical protein
MKAFGESIFGPGFADDDAYVQPCASVTGSTRVRTAYEPPDLDDDTLDAMYESRAQRRAEREADRNEFD